MAPRLTVIISQAARRDSRAADVEETLLGELMMASGLDATLIGPLEHVAIESTDYLCLSGFNHSIALASWLSTAEVVEHWQRLQLPGQVVPWGQAAAAGSSTRVYHFDLQSGSPAVVAGLRQLLSQRSVQTVSIALPGGNVGSGVSLTAKLPVAPQRSRSQPAAPPPQSTSPARPLPPRETAGSADDEKQWANLDQLVDDFDSLDL